MVRKSLVVWRPRPMNRQIATRFPRAARANRATLRRRSTRAGPRQHRPSRPDELALWWRRNVVGGKDAIVSPIEYMTAHTSQTRWLLQAADSRFDRTCNSLGDAAASDQASTELACDADNPASPGATVARSAPRRPASVLARNSGGAPHGSFCPTGPALSGGLAVDVASAAPALATGRERRRAPPRPSSLANASGMCDAGDASPTTGCAAQRRRLRSPWSGARRRHRGSCRSVAIGPTDALARRPVLPDR